MLGSADGIHTVDRTMKKGDHFCFLLLNSCSYPRIGFFQSNQVRNLMVDVLFIQAKLYPDISYRQVKCFVVMCDL